MVEFVNKPLYPKKNLLETVVLSLSSNAGASFFISLTFAAVCDVATLVKSNKNVNSTSVKLEVAQSRILTEVLH